MNRRGASLSPSNMSRFFAPEITQLLPCASPARPTRATFSAVSALRNTRSGCCATLWNSVVVEPGHSAQTRTPNSRSSSAIPSAKIRSNAFVAAYTELNGTAWKPAIDATIRTSPCLRPTIKGTYNRVNCTTAEQFTWIISSMRVSGISWIYPKAPKPALFTSSSISIPLPLVNPRISDGASGRARSDAKTSTLIPCFAPRSEAIFCSRSIRRAVRTRCVPPAASSWANARPIPALAPVTNAHFPAHLLGELPITDTSLGLPGMKPQLGMVRKQEIELGDDSGGAIGAVVSRENGVANAPSLLFQPVKQAARPDELCSKNSQSQQDRQPAGAWRNDHDDAESKQRESEQNLQETFRLLETPNKHPLDPLHPLGCIIRDSDARNFRARTLPITACVGANEFPSKMQDSCGGGRNGALSRFQYWEIFSMRGMKIWIC